MVEFRDESSSFMSQQNSSAKDPSVRQSEKADQTREEHLYSDVDVSPQSQHHSLGPGPTQSAAGNHLHDSRYSSIHHQHGADDLPPVVVIEEVVRQTTAPVLGDYDPMPEIWIDPTVPDARPEYVSATYETDPYAVTVTTAAHPTKWGKLNYSPPADGCIEVNANVHLDASGLTNSRWARWYLRIYRIDGTLLNGKFFETDRTSAGQTISNSVICDVVGGETYYVSLEFRLSHTNGTTFTVDSATIDLMYEPGAVMSSITIETDP